MSTIPRPGMRQFGTALLLLGSMRFNLADAATLPIPCVSGVCGSFVTSGQASAAQTANTLTVNQLTDKAILNWASFNISADGNVVFNQLTGKNAIALNRIHDANPSQIFGSLKSNGQIYLINQNGILFGATANVNTGGLLASTLNMTDQVFNDGLLSALQTGSTTGVQNALFKDGASSTIAVKPGAKITTNDSGQRVLLAAGTVENGGDITAIDGGQVVLAAGQKVYIAASDDAKLRGLLVEVDGGGTVTNTGSVTAERGNVTAVGLAVNQNGRVSATTSVSQNGSIRLLARDTVNVARADSGVFQIQAVTQGGALTLGANSSTQVNLDTTSTAKAIDDQEQSPSTVDLVGKTIDLKAGSQIIAHGGQLTAIAASSLTSLGNNIGDEPTAHFRMEDGASIDLSGSVANTSVTRNLLAVELRANELADAPLQRDGVLRGKTVVIDARVGTPLAKVDGAIALIERDVAERTSTGGTVAIETTGDVVMASKASINVSGGAVNVAGGAMRTSQLVKADGTTVDIGNASPNEIYAGLITPAYKKVDDRWGIIEEISGPGLGQYEAGYVDGKSAGTVQLLGSRMVLQGSFAGLVKPGVNQRTPTTAPLGGQFVLGTLAGVTNPSIYHAPELLLSQAVPTIGVGSSSSLPGGLPLQLSTDFITQGGFSRVSLSSSKAITLTEGSSFDLGPGGNLLLQAPRVDIRSSVIAAGGTITASARNVTTFDVSAPGLFIGDKVSLDVSGRWVNDSQLLVGTVPTAAEFINAGSITLQQLLDGGRLQLGNSVSLLADGGAWQKQSGALSGGAGGAISILSPLAGLQAKAIDIGGNLLLRGFGVANSKGGQFALTVPRLQIAPGVSALQISNLTTSTVNGGNALLSPQFFTDYGFGTFKLVADGLPLGSDAARMTAWIAPGTDLNLASRTLQFAVDTTRVANASSVRGLTREVFPLIAQRRPVSFSLSVAPNIGLLDRYGSLQVGSGAVVRGTAGSTVKLASSGNLLFAGEIDLRAGQVSLVNGPPGDATQSFYFPRLVELAAGSLIDLSGGVVYQPNDAGLSLGTVLAGGSLTLDAQRGSVFARPGSVINLSGSQAVLDLVATDATEPYAHKLVTSAGGTLTVSAAESFALQGSLKAGGGGTDAAGHDVGGTLNASLTRQIPGEGVASFPTGPRVVQLTAQSTAVPANGIGALDANYVKASQIDTLNLQADDRIDIGAGVDLTLNRQISLDTAVLSSLGIGNATLAAGYVAIGPRQFLVNRPTATTGAGQLTVRAQQIDLYESVALRNMNQTNLASTGDITLRGYNTYPKSTGGALLSAGNLNLSAQRIIAESAGQFLLSAANTLRIDQVGSNPGVPLSVGATLTLSARDIIQGGTLYAPFGQINFNAVNSIQVLSGSVTSVSGNGAVIPWGRVDNGNSWVYGYDPLSPSPVTAIPDRRIAVVAPQVTLAQGAVLNISGGGDLYAAQFTPGTGGSKDVLAGGVLENTFALLPGLAGQSVPYDPMLWASSGLTAGQSLYVAAGSALAAGTYSLLPARYALLPGAYLVNPAAAAYSTLQPGETAKTVDGATIVAGYRSFLNLTNPVATWTGYEIRPGSYARSLAQYDDHYASAFFAGSNASTGLRNAIPADAGTLSVAVSQSLSALATVQARAATGGENATIQISAPAMRVSAGSGSVVPGVVSLVDSVLTGWNAGHLVLGATSNTAGALTVGAQTVEVQSGASVTADEIILTAEQSIAVNAGAKLATTSAAVSSTVLPESRFAESVTLSLVGGNSGRAAVLGISDLAYRVLNRQQSAVIGAGTITLGSGATLATRGALTLDAPGTITLPAGAIVADGASFALGGSRVTMGGSSTLTNTLNIDTSLSALLQKARSVSLSSATTLDLLQGTSLAGTSAKPIGTLSLSASGIRNLSTGSSSQFSASRIVLANPTSSSLVPIAGSGSLSLNADQIVFGQGVVTASGFASVALQSAGTVGAKAIGGLSTAAPVNVTASALVADSGAQLSLDAGLGNLGLAGSGTAAPTLGNLPMGGLIRLHGNDVTLGAALLAPGGRIDITADRNLNLSASSLLNASGYTPADASIGATGGFINLSAGAALDIAAGSRLAVNGATAADAGIVNIVAGGAASLAGTFSGNAAAGQEGGSFNVKAGSLLAPSALNAGLQSGGFTGDRSIEVTTGDLQINSGDSIRARNITLQADSGAVYVNGSLAAIDDERRGGIAINAAKDIAIGATATLSADASDASQYRAGNIELMSSAGTLRFASGSVVRATGYGKSGKLTLIAPATSNDINISGLPADLSKVDQLVISPIKSYSLGDTPSSDDFEAIRSSVAGYVSAARLPTLTRLGLASTANAQYSPYLSLQRAGDLTLTDLDVSGWRFVGTPATLAIRATGGIAVTGVLSDGYTGDAETLTLLGTVAGNQRSASWQLSAGTDISFADGAIIRTGTGDIRLSAGRDVIWGDGASVYTGGLMAANSRISSEGITNYADKGGSIRLSAGRDVLGKVVTQSPSDWLLRSVYTTQSGGLGVNWGVDAHAFGWNIGVLGGGDIAISAGRNTVDLSAAVADSAISLSTTNRLTLAGGNLRIRSANDINTGYFLVSRGYADLSAGGAFGASGNRTVTTNKLGSLLISGDSSFKLSAVGNVLLEGMFPAFGIVPTRSTDDFETDNFLFFNRYSARNFLDVTSNGGSVVLRSQPATFLDGDSVASSDLGIHVAPSLALGAFGQDLTASASLMSAATGQLDLYARRDIVGGIYLMSDVNANLYTAGKASDYTGYYGDYQYAARELIHTSDITPAHITAGRDISGPQFYLPKAVEVKAGRDAKDVLLNAQHVGSLQTSYLMAGRDIGNFSDIGGGITRGKIDVGGQGRLEVLAGRNIDLEFSQGVTTSGRLLNANLPSSQGADLLMLPGLNAALGLTANAAKTDFINAVVLPSSAYQQELIAYVAKVNSVSGLSFDAALTQFRALPLSQQLPWAVDVLFRELVASGREANKDAKLGFSRGYKAIEGLFPGNNPSDTKASNAFAGDLTLPYSRIYTLSGGTIALLVPGGRIDVGLSTPPAGLAKLLDRGPSQLGIVAQGSGSVDIFTNNDVNVNSSRIFTLGGGDIAIWSSKGNIDAGKGAKSAISAAPPTLLVDAQGNVVVSVSSAVAGSGIRTIITDPKAPTGNVDLIAPLGFVNAGDAGIGSAGNLNIAAQTVVGLDNIQVGGSSSGVPPEAGGLGVSLAGASAAGSSSSNAATGSTTAGNAPSEQAPSAGQAALSFLEVFVLGLGEDTCRSDDLECLKRQKVQ